MSNLTNIAIGLIVVGLLLVRQMQPRPARETSSIRLALVLGVIGIAEIRHAIGSHHLTATTVAWLVLSLLAGAGLGALRAATVSIWRAKDGSAWRQGDHPHRRPVAGLPGHPPHPGRGHRPLHPDRRPRDLEHPALPGRNPRGPAGDRALARGTSA